MALGKKLSIDQTAEELGISRRGVRRLISAGELRAFRIGKGIIRIDSDDLGDVLKPVMPSGKPQPQNL